MNRLVSFAVPHSGLVACGSALITVEEEMLGFLSSGVLLYSAWRGVAVLFVETSSRNNDDDDGDDIKLKRKCMRIKH